MPIKHKLKLGKKDNTKIPLKNIFKNIFGEDNIYPKIGFAGYPNECSKFLPIMNKWYVLDLLDIDNTKDFIPGMNFGNLLMLNFYSKNNL